MLVSKREVFRSFPDVHGYLQKSSKIFGKCSETFRWSSDNFWRIIGKVQKVHGLKFSENCRKRRFIISIFKYMTRTLYNKKKMSWLRGDAKFISLVCCLVRISWWPSLFNSRSWTSYARPSNILYIPYPILTQLWKWSIQKTVDWSPRRREEKN